VYVCHAVDVHGPRHALEVTREREVTSFAVALRYLQAHACDEKHHNNEDKSCDNPGCTFASQVSSDEARYHGQASTGHSRAGDGAAWAEREPDEFRKRSEPVCWEPTGHANSVFWPYVS
jgi:hypothetical protein